MVLVGHLVMVLVILQVLVELMVMLGQMVNGVLQHQINLGLVVVVVAQELQDHRPLP